LLKLARQKNTAIFFLQNSTKETMYFLPFLSNVARPIAANDLGLGAGGANTNLPRAT